MTNKLPTECQFRDVHISIRATVERGDTSVGIYSDGLPGCVAVAKTEAKAQCDYFEAVKMHLGFKPRTLCVWYTYER